MLSHPHTARCQSGCIGLRVPAPWGLLQQGQWAGPRLGTIGPSSQALVSCHSSPSCCAGGILQDYYSNLCFSLKTGDVKILRKRERRAHLDLPSAPTRAARPGPRPPAPGPPPQCPCPALLEWPCGQTLGSVLQNSRSSSRSRTPSAASSTRTTWTTSSNCSRT